MSACDSEPTYCTKDVAGRREVSPGSTIQGTRVDDILDQYSGTYSGSLGWSDGGMSDFSLTVTYPPDEPYVLINVWQCRAREISRDANVRVATTDGLIDHEMPTSVRSPFPGIDVPVIPYSVVGSVALPQSLWGEDLRARIPVDIGRYDQAFLRFTFDWPKNRPPSGGDISFQGRLAGTEFDDKFVVATISWKERPQDTR